MTQRGTQAMRSGGGIIQKAAEGNAVATKNGNGGIQSLMKAMMPGIRDALPSVMTPERFVRICNSAFSKNPALAENPMSCIASVLTAAQLGLEPNTPLGHCYLIGYRNKGRMECQFQLGWRGMVELAYRSGSVSSIQAHTVYENDEFSYELGLDPKIRHIPAMKDRGEAVAYYAVFKTKDGGFGFEVMSRQDVEAHAKRYSQSYGRGYNSPWTTSFDEMAKKTCVKKALRYCPMKSEFARAMAADESFRSNISDDFLDDIASTAIPVNPETGEIESADAPAPAETPEG